MSKVSILDVLDNNIKDVAMRNELFELHGKLAEWEVKLGVTESTDITTLPADQREPIRKLLLAIDDVHARQLRWERQYKASLRKLIEINKGLPVHINAIDIHEHNINVDVIEQQVADDDERMNILDCFTDGTMGLWAIAPYNFTFMQLETKETFEKSLGLFYDKAQEPLTRKKHLADIFTADDEVLEKIEQDITGQSADERDEIKKLELSRDTFVITQSYRFDDIIEYIHMQNVEEESIGADINDTFIGHWQMEDLINGNLSEEQRVALSSQFEGDVSLKDFTFLQVYDILTLQNGQMWLEHQVVAWLDENGSPTITRKIVWNDKEDKHITSTSAYYTHAVEKVFQWWNMDNDLLEVADIETRPSWSKKLKKYNKKSKTKQKSIRYKTLVVKPSIKVIDTNGVERTPRMREIAQHTRRGHFAHYGINGNGKLFGKYTKSVYRKPKTIGKLANGLVLKDYTLETEKGDQDDE